jgi:hypothetical protein
MYVNLAVREVSRSIMFFTKLGFNFNPEFTDDHSACMVINPDACVMLTGYLGGAVATNVRVVGPVFNIVFPIVFATLLWGGLWLRDRRLQDLLPIRAR